MAVVKKNDSNKNLLSVAPKKASAKSKGKPAPKATANTAEKKEEKAPAMNEPEVQSAKKADERAVANGASSERLNLLLGMVSSKFGLDDTYAVCKFIDKGKVMDISLENSEFVVSVTVKDSERHGLIVE